jgi:hypothetical protein
MEKIIIFFKSINWGFIYIFLVPIFFIESISKKLAISPKKIYLTVMKIIGWLIMFVSLIIVIFGESIITVLSDNNSIPEINYMRIGLEFLEFGLLLILVNKTFKD